MENEGFKVPKNRGFNLKHPYSQNERAMKNFYLLLQIAYLISQLIEKGSLLKEKIERVFGSEPLKISNNFLTFLNFVLK